MDNVVTENTECTEVKPDIIQFDQVNSVETTSNVIELSNSTTTTEVASPQKFLVQDEDGDSVLPTSIIESQTAQPVEAELPETEADVTSIATETNVPTAIPEDETELETSSVASSGKMALSYEEVKELTPEPPMVLESEIITEEEKQRAAREEAQRKIKEEQEKRRLEAEAKKAAEERLTAEREKRRQEMELAAREEQERIELAEKKRQEEEERERLEHEKQEQERQDQIEKVRLATVNKEKIELDARAARIAEIKAKMNARKAESQPVANTNATDRISEIMSGRRLNGAASPDSARRSITPNQGNGTNGSASPDQQSSNAITPSQFSPSQVSPSHYNTNLPSTHMSAVSLTNGTNTSGDSSPERVPQPLSNASSLFMKFANGKTNGNNNSSM